MADLLNLDKAAKDATEAIATVDIPAAEAAANRIVDRLLARLDGAKVEFIDGGLQLKLTPLTPADPSHISNT